MTAPAKSLQELRELRQKAGAKARVSRELAGLDTKRAEADFMEYAQNSEANDEFDALIGLSDAPQSDTQQEEPRIPE